VRVNAELRELTVVGVIRPEYITSLNEVPYDKIAEARSLMAAAAP
jgi:flagellar L-ring protein precursor FlgH